MAGGADWDVEGRARMRLVLVGSCAHHLRFGRVASTWWCETDAPEMLLLHVGDERTLLADDAGEMLPTGETVRNSRAEQSEGRVLDR